MKAPTDYLDRHWFEHDGLCVPVDPQEQVRVFTAHDDWTDTVFEPACVYDEGGSLQNTARWVWSQVPNEPYTHITHFQVMDPAIERALLKERQARAAPPRRAQTKLTGARLLDLGDGPVAITDKVPEPPVQETLSGTLHWVVKTESQDGEHEGRCHKTEAEARKAFDQACEDRSIRSAEIAVLTRMVLSTHVKSRSR